MILESDIALDVKSTISTVEDIQNYKMEFHEINDNKDKILSSLNKNDAELNCDVDNVLANEPSSITNNKTDLNTSDLDALHSEKRNLDPNVHNSNIGECLTENEIGNKPEENGEEDDLEDDIISLREDSFNEVSELHSNIEKDILLEENIINENGLTTEKDTMHLSKDHSETAIENETEVIELKEIKDTSDNCEKEIQNKIKETSEESKEGALPSNNFCINEIDVKEPLMFKDKKDDSSDQCETETVKETKEYLIKTELSCEKAHAQEEVQIIELKNETDQSNDPCTTRVQAQVEIEIEDLTSENEAVNSLTKVQEETKIVQISDETEIQEKVEIIESKDEIKDIEPVEESKSSMVPCGKEAEIMEVDDCYDVTEQVVAVENINACKHKKESESVIYTSNSDVEMEEKEPLTSEPSELRKSDQNEIPDVILTLESAVPSDNRSEFIDRETLVENNLKNNLAKNQQSDTVNELVSTTIQSENNSTIVIEDRLTDKDNVDAEIISGQCENKNESSTKSEASTSKSIITDILRENDSSKSSETKIDISDTIDLNSPAAKEIDITDSKEDIIETKVDSEPINLDAEDVVEQTSINDATTTVKDLASYNDSNTVEKVNPVPPVSNKENLIACKSSYTLDIFSDEEELPGEESSEVAAPQNVQEKAKECVNLIDDDDIMLIDEDTSKPDEKIDNITNNKSGLPNTLPIENTTTEIKENPVKEYSNVLNQSDQQDMVSPAIDIKDKAKEIDINKKSNENTIEKPKELGPLIPEKFLNTAKTKLSDMTRDDLEEFCILKIVEGIVDRTSLSEIKKKLKEMSQSLEDYRKKTLLLTKQNRDLQVVLKSVQEEQKKINRDTPITPLKITRSVGVQVFMEKAMPRKKIPQQNANNKSINTPPNKNPNPTQRVAAPTKIANQNIPVPRLVPANIPLLKTPSAVLQTNTPNKTNTPNGVRNPSPALKAEKRPHNKIASSSETVDLTDDEPPSKLPVGAKTSPTPPVRLVPSQNLMAPQRQPFQQAMNSPRKVYIPISGPPNQSLRPGQTIMLKSVPAPGVRARGPAPQRMESMRLNRILTRHPAPLPFATKQYQPPNWKSLPPAPDLKLSKVENGIVISWKIEDVPEDSYEEIASYQLFAYQETSLPANTALWKKIGDVKALPLPMACTLTQFMAGFKYYFAVRAVDIRSRLGPFSLPGSILLLNKNILD